MKRDIHLVVLLLSVIFFSLASLTLWKLMTSREHALEEINTHGLNLTQALSTYSEGIVRQSSLLLLGLVWNDWKLKEAGRSRLNGSVNW